MIRADAFSPDVWEAICTPMHEILPASPSSGIGALFLGSWTAAVDPELLLQHSVSAIVECHDAPWGVAESSFPSFNRSPTSPTGHGHGIGSLSTPTRPSFGRSVSSNGVQQQQQQQPPPPPPHHHHHQLNGFHSGSSTTSTTSSSSDAVSRFKVAIPDSPAPDLLTPHLEGAVRFIRDRLSRGENVLVHCQQGISRSPAIVCAYLMRERALSYDAALQVVKARRKCIKPNAGFEKTLRAWKP